MPPLGVGVLLRQPRVGDRQNLDVVGVNRADEEGVGRQLLPARRAARARIELEQPLRVDERDVVEAGGNARRPTSSMYAHDPVFTMGRVTAHSTAAAEAKPTPMETSPTSST